MKYTDNTESSSPENQEIPLEIKEKLELYGLMVQESSDVIWIMDFNLRTTYMSPSVEKHLGYTVEEYSQLSLADRIPQESFELSQEIYKSEIFPIVSGEQEYDGKPIIYEMLHKHKNGQLVWGEISFSFIRDKSGKIISIMGITRNIDARKRAEQELERSREQYRMLVENTNDWIWETDIDNKFTYCNPAAERILGYPLHQIIGSGFFEYSTEATRQSEILRFEQFKNSAFPFAGLRHILTDANQRIIHLDVNGSPIFDSEGNLSGYHGMSRDVSNYQLLLKKLNRLEARQSGLLSQPDFGVIELDSNFEILEWSVGATRIFGYSRGEAMVGKIFKSLWESTAWLSFVKELEANTIPVPRPFFVDEKRNKRLDSKEIHCNWYLNPIIEDEYFKSIVIFVKDVSEIKEYSDALSQFQMFTESYCGALVFADTRLRINGFPPASIDYFSSQLTMLKGTHIRNLFDKESAKIILEQGVNYATRMHSWQGEVTVKFNAIEKPASLEIVSQLNKKGKLKGFALIFDKIKRA
jgi:PAS domain S-box-containing protein